MKPRLTSIPSLVAVVGAAVLSSGCASLFLRSTEELEVVTDPPGATASAGGSSVVTPGKLKIRRQKEELVVRIEKKGFQTRLVALKFHRAGAIWANSAFLFGGLAAGVVKDAADNFKWGDSGTTSAGTGIGLAIGAVATAVGVAVDLSSEKTWSPERDSIVLRLERLPAPAAEGGSR